MCSSDLIKKDGATNTAKTKNKALKPKRSITQKQPENQDSGAKFQSGFEADPEIPFNNLNMPKDLKSEQEQIAGQMSVKD